MNGIDAVPTEWVELARTALVEVTPESSVGQPIGTTDEGDGVVSVLFSNRMPGYPGWRWTVSIAKVGDDDPTVLEVELMPGDGSLLAPEWVPWSERLAEYRAAQEHEDAEDSEDEDSDDEDADEDDEFDDDAEYDDADEDSDSDDSDDDEDDLDESDEDDLDESDDDELDGVDVDELDDSDEEEDSDEDEDEDPDDEDSDDEDGARRR